MERLYLNASVYPQEDGFVWAPFGGDCTVQIIRDELTGQLSAGWWRGAPEDLPVFRRFDSQDSE